MMQSQKSFTQDLAKLNSAKEISINTLLNTFKEKSFSIIIIFLMILPALPLPTGGVSHLFEIIAMLLTLEFIAGRESVWLPEKWKDKKLPNKFNKSVLPKLIKISEIIEKLSNNRGHNFFKNKIFKTFLGIFILFFTLVAFLGPPFSGLDTLPALGVVVISLSLIFEDILISLLGIIIGSIGLALILLLSKFVYTIF